MLYTVNLFTNKKEDSLENTFGSQIVTYSLHNNKNRLQMSVNSFIIIILLFHIVLSVCHQFAVSACRRLATPGLLRYQMYPFEQQHDQRKPLNGTKTTFLPIGF